MNRVTLMGWLGNDPIINHTKNNTPVCNFSVATNKKWKDSNGEMKESTTWHRVTTWGNRANTCMEHLKKGSQVLVEGEIVNRSWERDGKTNWTTEINANDVSFIGRNNDTVNNAPEFAVENIPF